jgi:hypothetical protein
MPWLTVLGIPAGVYVMSVTALMFLVNGKPQNSLLLSGVGFLTIGIYIFHRSTVVAVEPMQQRHRIALQHTTLLRWISCCLLMGAVVIFALHQPIAPLLVFGSLGGVYVYGRKTFIKPLRTYPYLKSIAVGVAITSFAWALNDFSNSILTVVAFVLMCSADAMVCDLLDREYDVATGCRTLAMQLGDYWTWIISTAVYCVASIGILFALVHSRVGFYIFVVYIASLTCRKFDSRYVVDLRLILVLLLAWGQWLFWTGQLH